MIGPIQRLQTSNRNVSFALKTLVFGARHSHTMRIHAGKRCLADAPSSLLIQASLQNAEGVRSTSTNTPSPPRSTVPSVVFLSRAQTVVVCASMYECVCRGRWCCDRGTYTTGAELTLCLYRGRRAIRITTGGSSLSLTQTNSGACGMFWEGGKRGERLYARRHHSDGAGIRLSRNSWKTMKR